MQAIVKRVVGASIVGLAFSLNASAAEFNFKFAHSQPESSVRHKSMLMFKEKLEKGSNDRIKVELFASNIGALQLLIPLAGAGIALALYLVRRYTRLGKVLEACVQNPRAAMLMGINVNRVVAIAFALSTVFAGIAGLLIAPLFSVNAEMGMLFGLKAFAVAILGGISSAGGVFTAGLLFGLTEALITLYFGSAFTQIFTFALVILALAIRPNGLFGTKMVEKV